MKTKNNPLLILSIAGSLTLGATSLFSQLVETTTVTFQQGVDGYTDTFELLLDADLVTIPGETADQFYLDGNPFTNQQDDKLDILRFDSIFGNGAGQIPTGATIINAFVTYTTGNDGNAVTGGPYNVARLIEVTDEFSFYDDYLADPPETRSYRAATARPWGAGVASVQTEEALDIDITEYVQAWGDGEPNYGILVFTNDTTDGWQISMIGNADPVKRPKLTVEFTTEDVSISTFQATRSALIRSNVDTVDGSSLIAEFLDSATDDVTEALFHFDIIGENDGQIGSQDQVLGAKLILQTAGAPDFSASADTSNPYTVHQMFIDWDVTTTFGVTGPIVVRGEVGEAVDRMIGMGELTRATADVTSIVSNWKSGQANYGLNVKPGGSNGWQIFWPGVGDAELVPMLKVWTVAGSGIPTATVSASVSEGRAPLTVNFDASGSADPGGGALEFAWDFSDGSQGTGATVTHEFAQAGIYDVALAVTDSDGNIAQAVSSVKVLGPPIAEFTLDISSGPEPLEIRVNASSSSDPDLGPLLFAWNFGDGNQAQGDISAHTYTRGGNFKLSLTVTDDEGEQAAVTKEVEVFETSIDTVSFQQGANGYEDTFEMRVRADGVVELGQDLAQYYLDGRPQDDNQAANDTVELIRFDNIIGGGAGQVPSGATVVNAQLTFHTGTAGAANSDGPYVVAMLNTSVDESTTYESLDEFFVTGLPEDAGPRGSVERPYLSGYASLDNEEVVSADITAFVQRWANGDSNDGLAIFTNDTSNGWQISTIGHEDVSFRPILTIEYTTGEVKEHVFETILTAIAEKETGVLLDTDALEAFFLDGGGDPDYKEGLFLFGDMFGSGANLIGPTERILSAKLVVQTPGAPGFSSNADSDDPYSVHQMLTAWDLSSEYGTTGVSIEDGQVSEAVSEFIGMGEQARTSADVTSVLYNWQAGEPNYGFNIKPQGSDGWQIIWPGSFDLDLIPRLIVYTEEALEPSQPTGPIEITGVQLTDGGNLAITWASSSGAQYRIESSVDLTTWAPVETTFASQGAETTFEITASAQSVLFLRITNAGQ